MINQDNKLCTYVITGLKNSFCLSRINVSNILKHFIQSIRIDNMRLTWTNSSHVMNPSLLRSILLKASSTRSSSGLTAAFLQQHSRPPLLWPCWGNIKLSRFHLYLLSLQRLIFNISSILHYITLYVYSFIENLITHKF